MSDTPMSVYDEWCKDSLGVDPAQYANGNTPAGLGVAAPPPPGAPPPPPLAAAPPPPPGAPPPPPFAAAPPPSVVATPLAHNDPEPVADDSTDEDSDTEDSEDDALNSKSGQELDQQDRYQIADAENYDFENELKWSSKEIETFAQPKLRSAVMALRKKFTSVKDRYVQGAKRELTAPELRDLLKKDEGLKRLQPLRDKLIPALKIPPEFEARTLSAAKETISAVLAKKDVKEAMQASDAASRARGGDPDQAALGNQLKVARAIADSYLEKLGLPREVIQNLKIEQVPLGTPVKGKVEFAAHERGKLLLNNQSKELLSKAKLVGTVTHELTHCYQDWVAENCRDDGHPDFESAITFFLNSDLYIPGGEDMAPYEQQPVEKQAIEVQAAIDELVRTM